MQTKKYGIYTVWICTALLLLSCNKEYNAQLTAKWQLREVITNGVSERKDSIFYNFDNSIFCFQKVYANAIDRLEVYAEFVQQADTLFIDIKDDRYAEPWILQRMEWNSRKKWFKIEKLSHSKLILSDSLSSYHFREF